MKKLPTLRERWSQIRKQFIHGGISVSTRISLFSKYLEFTEKPLELGQFVPCNSKGEPMEKLKPLYVDEARPPSEIQFYNHNLLVKEYQKALDKVLFDGCLYAETSIDMGNGIFYKIDYRITPEGRFMMLTYSGEIFRTIEDLINSEIELEPTEACKNQIGL